MPHSPPEVASLRGTRVSLAPVFPADATEGCRRLAGAPRGAALIQVLRPPQGFPTPCIIGPDKFGGRSGLDGRKGAEYGALISAKPGFSKIFLGKCGVE